jgi:uncharacterized protein YsxB (DUF464 family)
MVIIILFGISYKQDESIYSNDVRVSNFNINDYKESKGVKAIFFYDANKIIYKFIIYGTTDYAEYGEDIIASAISVLSINTINSILEYTSVNIKYQSSELYGKPYLEGYVNNFKSNEEKHDYMLLIKSLLLGLTSIQEVYGIEYLDVIEIY